MLKPTTMRMNVRKMMKTKDTLRFDLAIQRNEVWDNERKSLFVHSILYGYPIPPMFAVDEGDKNIWFLDGQQRSTTVLTFLEDGFVITENTPSVKLEDGTEVEIAGKSFSMLPEELKDEFMHGELQIIVFKDITEEERDEIFLRLNNGAPLRPIELTRVLFGSHLMKTIQEVASKPFFENVVRITAKAKNRFVDEETLLQILAILHNKGEAVSLNGKDLKSLAIKLRDDGLSDEIVEDLIKTSDYLSEAFPVYFKMDKTPEQEKFMKKVNIPMIFVTANQARKDNITPLKFSGWVREFFNVRFKSPSNAYNDTLKAGSAKKDKVATRLSVMRRDYADHVKNAPEYTALLPKNMTIEEAVAWSEKIHGVNEAAGTKEDWTEEENISDSESNEDESSDKSEDESSKKESKKKDENKVVSIR